MRPRRYLTVISASCVLLSGVPSSAGPIELFGYFESQLNYQRVRDRDYTLQYNKLRLDMQKRPSDRVFFGANVDYINYNGATDYNALDFVPDVPLSRPEASRPFYEIHFRDSVFVDNAFIQLSLKQGDLTVGRQQLSYGSGYAWNPTDIFNVKLLLDPTYEQPGHNAVRLDIPAGTRGGVSMVWSPGDDWDRSVYYGRLKWRFGHFDVSASHGRTFSRFTRFRETITTAENRRRLYGGDIVGELLGLGVWGEAAWNVVDNTDDYLEALIGGDYTFSFHTSVLCEYYHNGYDADPAFTPLEDAAGHEPEYSFNQWLRLVYGEVKTLGRDYLFVFVEHPVHDLVSAGMFSIINGNDGSSIFNPQAVWYPFQDVEVTGIVNLGMGPAGTEFGTFDPSGLVRIRVSF